MSDQQQNENGNGGEIARADDVGFVEGKGLMPRTFEGAWRIARCAKASGLAPRGLESEAALVIAMSYGAEVGLSPMQAIQSVAVVNGRPSLFGDAPLALCQGSGKLEDFHEEPFGKPGTDGYGWRCTVKRRDRRRETVRVFTVADATLAGLWGKSGPWKQYPDRMLQFRARGFALRDTFPDVLKGMGIGEEQRDIETVREAEARDVTREQGVDFSQPAAAPITPDAVDLPPYEAQEQEPPRKVRLGASA